MQKAKKIKKKHLNWGKKLYLAIFLSPKLYKILLLYNWIYISLTAYLGEFRKKRCYNTTYYSNSV